MFLANRSIFQKGHALQEKPWFVITTFSTTPPLSITGFLRAHHIEQSRALLYMAHAGMEPLWAAECILMPSHYEEIFSAEAAEHNPSYLLWDCSGSRRSSRVLIEPVASVIEAKRVKRGEGRI